MEIIKRHLDEIFDLFLQVGITNRFDTIYQVTCLLYLKSLEDIENVKGRDYLYMDSVFAGHEQYKWSFLVQMDPKKCHVLFTKKIIPFLGQQPLGIRIDSSHFLSQSVASDLIFYRILISIDKMFYEALGGKEMSKKTIGLYEEIYECLLSYLVKSIPKTKMLFAPKYLRRLVCELAQLRVPDTVFDPAMGIGNLLMDANYTLLVKASHKYNLTFDADDFPALVNFAESALSEDLNEDFCLEGEERDFELRFLCQMNFYFHFANLKQPQFYNGFQSDTLKTQYFQKIVSVLPIHKHTADIIDMAVDKLLPNGLAVMIVPMSFLYNSTPRQQNLRSKLLQKFRVEAVVGLPEHEFEPQAVVNTAILVVRNCPSNVHDKIWFCDLHNDGYSNDRKRNKNAYNPLPILIDNFLRKDEEHNDWFDSKLIAISEVLENNASLLVAQYVDTYDEPVENMDLDVIIEHLDYFQGKIKEGINELRRYL